MAARKKKENQSSGLKKILIVLCILLVLAIALIVIYITNQIVEVQVEGNEFYTDEEIQELMIDGELERNAWYLYWKYNYSEPPEIPFVDTIEVEVTGRGKVKVQVYEKSIIGYVEYLGSYMYFDKDGTVVESSQEEVGEVPKIIGLSFDSIALYEKLPVEKDEVFDFILNLTKELRKNEIYPDKLQFNEQMEATLHFGQARVYLGKDENQNEKITRLKSVIGQLEGKSGVLHMEEVDEDNKSIIFEKDAE